MQVHSKVTLIYFFIVQFFASFVHSMDPDFSEFGGEGSGIHQATEVDLSKIISDMAFLGVEIKRVGESIKVVCPESSKAIEALDALRPVKASLVDLTVPTMIVSQDRMYPWALHLHVDGLFKINADFFAMDLNVEADRYTSADGAFGRLVAMNGPITIDVVDFENINGIVHGKTGVDLTFSSLFRNGRGVPIPGAGNGQLTRKRNGSAVESLGKVSIASRANSSEEQNINNDYGIILSCDDEVSIKTNAILSNMAGFIYGRTGGKVVAKNIQMIRDSDYGWEVHNPGDNRWWNSSGELRCGRADRNNKNGCWGNPPSCGGLHPSTSYYRSESSPEGLILIKSGSLSINYESLNLLASRILSGGNIYMNVGPDFLTSRRGNPLDQHVTETDYLNIPILHFQENRNTTLKNRNGKNAKIFLRGDIDDEFNIRDVADIFERQKSLTKIYELEVSRLKLKMAVLEAEEIEAVKLDPSVEANYKDVTAELENVLKRRDRLVEAGKTPPRGRPFSGAGSRARSKSPGTRQKRVQLVDDLKNSETYRRRNNRTPPRGRFSTPESANGSQSSSSSARGRSKSPRSRQTQSPRRVSFQTVIPEENRKKSSEFEASGNLGPPKSTDFQGFSGIVETYRPAIEFLQHVISDSIQNPVFIEHDIAKDGDCGFHGLGLSREEAGRQLIEEIERQGAIIHLLLLPDLLEAFRGGDWPQSLRNDQEYQRLRTIYPVGEGTVDNEDLRNYLLQPHIQIAFIVDYISGGGWMTYVRGQTGMLDALAQIRKLQVNVWVPSEGNRRKLDLVHTANPGSNQVTNLIHRDGLTHFNFLEIKEQREGLDLETNPNQNSNSKKENNVSRLRSFFEGKY